MKSILLSVLSLCSFLFTINNHAAGNVTITSVAVPAGNMNQGSTSNVIYIAKLDVTVADLSINTVSVTLSGNYSSTDLGNISIFYNSTTPSLAGASLANNAPGNFAGPHLFSIPANIFVAAGNSVYILITVNTTSTATDNHTVSIDGAANPLTITATGAPAITNNQTNAAGVQTIQAADVTFTTVALPAGNMNQGSTSNIVYIAKMDVGTEPVTITDVHFNLAGTYDNDDLGNISIFYNSTTPSLAGASLANNALGNFGGPHLFNIPANIFVAAGNSIYIIITVNTAGAANDNHTVYIDGAAGPLTITATTVPNITNNQTNAAGVQTIQAADVTFTTIALPAANINQGSNSNIVYIEKMDVSTEPVDITKVNFNLSGTYDNDDLGNISIYFNTSAPTLTGASLANNALGNFAGPHLFSVDLNWHVNAGSTVYVIIAVNLASSATDMHTISVNGAVDPLGITATTAPNFVNNQTNLAGVQTIRAAGIILTTVSLPATNIVPGSSSNIIYALKLDVGTQPVVLNNVQVTLSGNYDNDDLNSLGIFINSTGPTISGASLMNNAATNFAGPHTFSVPANANIAAGTIEYILITANVASSATISNTLSVDGAANPVVLGFTTVPDVINNQSNLAGVFYISNTTLPLKLTSFAAKKPTDKNQVQLDWITASEINTKNFDVQWSTDGLSYTSAGSVAAEGNSQLDKHYTFTHISPAKGINYYRLKMIDIDGKFTFSPVVTVQINIARHAIMIAPNPVSTQLRIVLNNTEQIKMLRIFDISGRIIWQSATVINTGVITVPFDAFGKGVYNVEVTTQNSIGRLSFIKVGK